MSSALIRINSKLTQPHTVKRQWHVSRVPYAFKGKSMSPYNLDATTRASFRRADRRAFRGTGCAGQSKAQFKLQCARLAAALSRSQEHRNSRTT